MKSLNTLVAASVLALAGAGFASATTVVHVTGSTAYRVADVTAEVDYLSANDSGSVAAYVGSNLTGSNTSIIKSNDGLYVFENSFNGSIAGDELVAGIGSKLAFPDYTLNSTYAATSAGSSTGAATGGASVSSLTVSATPVYADIAFSDVSSATANNILNLVPGAGSYSYTDNGILGVVPFVFVANATTDVTDFGTTTTATSTASGTFTYATATVAANVTPQSFARLWSAGAITTSARHPEIFTGNPADSTLKIYALGRDIDSGTRSTALAETGYPLSGNGGQAVTQSVIQEYPLDSTGTLVVGNSSNAPIASFEEVPASTVDTIPLGAGDGGYNSGGHLSEALSDTFSGPTRTVEIGYLGTSDAYNALTNQAGATTGQPALLLSYNGVSFNPAGSSATKNYATSGDLNKIYYGSYTYWGYEHEFFNENNGYDPTTIADGLVTQLKGDQVDQLSAAGVQLGSMVVSRTDDGLEVK